MKAYIVYQGMGHNNFHAALVGDNGYALASHICSSPGFMAGDLWTRRTERQESLKKEFGEIEVDLTPMHIDEFKEKYPDLYKLAVSKEENNTEDSVE